MKPRFIIGLLITIGVAGCDAAPPYFELPVGHPANPYGRPAAPIAVPAALEPETTDAQPQLGTQKENPLPSDNVPAGNQHQHHQ